MRLFLVRHGQPDSPSGICYGSSDLAVADEEHRRVVGAVAGLLPKGVPIYSSPLLRCRVLAEQVAAAIEAQRVEHDARLAEMHFGRWEMQPWASIPRDEIDAWAADPVAYRPGGGESVLEAAQRVRAFHADVLLRNDEAAVVVCHAGTIRLLLQCMSHMLPADMALSAAMRAQRIDYGESIILDC